MKKVLAAAAGALMLCLAAPATQAAPLGAAAPAPAADVSSNVIQVHGLHSVCRRDRFGWHRSHVWGRTHCAPPWVRPHHRHYPPYGHHHHHHKHWKKWR